MMRNRTRKGARTLACLAAGVLLFAVAAQAENSSQSASAGRGAGLTYDQAKENAIVGTVKELVIHPEPGTPVGLHILLSTSGGTVDAHLGPYLSKDIQEALKTAPMVQVIGVTQTIGGKDIVLARQLTFSGRQVTIRNERGFLIRQRVTRRTRDSKPAVNGGAQ